MLLSMTVLLYPQDVATAGRVDLEVEPDNPEYLYSLGESAGFPAI